MSSIGFSRLSRNSVRELLSPLLGEGFSWLMGFGLRTSRTPVFYQMGLKELPVRELDFCDSTGFESLPTETSCRSGNCARILVSKLSESGNTTFSVDHHDDASSKTTCGGTYALLVVGSTHLHPFFCSSYPAFFSNFVRPVEDKDVAKAPEVMNPYADQGMFQGDVCEAGDPLSELLEKHEEVVALLSLLERISS